MSREMDIQPTANGLQFTRGWFRSRNLATFREYIYPEWNPRTNVTYLEIGVFEAASLVWMMQHVVGASGHAVGIDPHLQTRKLDEPYMEGVRKRAIHNLKPWTQTGKAQLIRGNSAEVLRRMLGKDGYAGIKKGSVDLCMIDGNHHAPYVADDAALVLQLVKPGGWILFDDVENHTKKKNHVKQGVEMWLQDHGSEVKQVWKHKFMECYEKL